MGYKIFYHHFMRVGAVFCLLAQQRMSAKLVFSLCVTRSSSCRVSSAERCNSGPGADWSCPQPVQTSSIDSWFDRLADAVNNREQVLLHTGNGSGCTIFYERWFPREDPTVCCRSAVSGIRKTFRCLRSCRRQDFAIDRNIYRTGPVTCEFC